MPLFEFQCHDCGGKSEILVTSSSNNLECRVCSSRNLKKLLSVPSSLTGTSKAAMSDTGPACCGVSPEQAGCAGPGSCCGKNLAVQ